MPEAAYDFKERVKNNTDIVDIISDYVELKKIGKNYKGLCPFHQEKTPSFTVNPANQFYYCFGCGVGGDVFKFLMEIEHITFRESLKLLSKRAGMEMPTQSKQQKRIYKKRDKLFEINNLAARFYNYLLTQNKIGEKALNYLKERGFTDRDIDRFNLGYAPDRWRSLLNFFKKKGYNQKQLLTSGLILKNKNDSLYDRFRNRVIFPIFNIRDEVLAFGGRIIENEESVPKYINSPETLIYDKGKNLYGLNWAKNKMRRLDEAIIMEGYTDVLSAHKAGIENAVASLGTALTAEQGKILKRHVSDVYIAYDSDTAGTNATIRGLEILKEAGLKVSVIDLPEGKDPDDFIKEKGMSAFEKLQEEALNLIDFKIDNILQNNDLSQTENRISTSREIIKVLAAIEDLIERDLYIQKVSQRLQIKETLLQQEVKKYYKSSQKDKNYKNRYNKNIQKTDGTGVSVGDVTKLQKKILCAFIDNPVYREHIIDRINLEYFNDICKKAAEYLWSNYEFDIQENMEEIEDEKVRNFLMSITVEENQRIDINMLDGWIDMLHRHRVYQNKINIYQKLQNNEINVEEVNKLLIKFQQLSGTTGKEGVSHG